MTFSDSDNANSDIDVVKLSELFLDPENREMVRNVKKDAVSKIEEFNNQINYQRKKIEHAQLRLQAAKTNDENPKYIIDHIEHTKLRLEKAKKEIAECERLLEILQARLPSENRKAQVENIEQEIKNHKKRADDLIQAKGQYTLIKNLIEKAEELKKLD